MNPITTTTLPTFLQRLQRDFVGYDALVTELQKLELAPAQAGFPPYNHVQIDENTYEVVIAIAGFSPEEVSVKLDNNLLTIEGKKAHPDANVYIHKGIALRDFSREFRLGQYIEVDSAEFRNGLLTIKLVRNIPDEKKPRVIEVKSV